MFSVTMCTKKKDSEARKFADPASAWYVEANIDSVIPVYVL